MEDGRGWLHSASGLPRCYDTSGGGQVVGPPGVWKEGNELELSPGSYELVEIPNCLWKHFSQIPIGTRYNKDLKKDLEKNTIKNHMISKEILDNFFWGFRSGRSRYWELTPVLWWMSPRPQAVSQLASDLNSLPEVDPSELDICCTRTGRANTEI